MVKRARSGLMDRRTFLRGATVVGSGVLAGAAAAGCSSSSPPDRERRRHLHVDDGRTAHPTGRSSPRRSAAPCSLPTDGGYAAAGHLYNSVYTQQAAAIAQCQSASDVQRCLAFAREHRRAAWRPARAATATPPTRPARAWSSTSRPERGVRRPGRRPGLATVGAGTILIDVYSQLAAQGLLLPGGSCPTVGIAGLALGGGIGVFARAYGLTCDQLQSVEIVTADGVRAPVRTGRRRGPLLGQPGRWRRQLRRRDLVRIPHPPHPRSHHPLHARVALGRRRRRARRLACAGSRPRPTSSGPTASSTAVGHVGSGLVKVTGVFVGRVSACTAALHPLTTAVGDGHDLPLRRAGGLPDGHHD